MKKLRPSKFNIRYKALLVRLDKALTDNEIDERIEVNRELGDMRQAWEDRNGTRDWKSYEFELRNGELDEIAHSLGGGMSHLHAVQGDISATYGFSTYQRGGATAAEMCAAEEMEHLKQERVKKMTPEERAQMEKEQKEREEAHTRRQEEIWKKEFVRKQREKAEQFVRLEKMRIIARYALATFAVVATMIAIVISLHAPVPDGALGRVYEDNESLYDTEQPAYNERKSE